MSSLIRAAAGWRMRWQATTRAAEIAMLDEVADAIVSQPTQFAIMTSRSTTASLTRTTRTV